MAAVTAHVFRSAFVPLCGDLMGFRDQGYSKPKGPRWKRPSCGGRERKHVATSLTPAPELNLELSCWG